MLRFGGFPLLLLSGKRFGLAPVLAATSASLAVVYGAAFLWSWVSSSLLLVWDGPVIFVISIGEVGLIIGLP